MTAPAFASEADAIAGEPVLFTISKDFELPGPSTTVDVPFTAP